MTNWTNDYEPQLCSFRQPFTVLEIESVGKGGGPAAEKMPSIDAVSRAGGGGGGAVEGGITSDNGGSSAGSLVDVGTGVIAGVALVVMVLMLVIVGLVLRR